MDYTEQEMTFCTSMSAAAAAAAAAAASMHVMVMLPLGPKAVKADRLHNTLDSAVSGCDNRALKPA
jgi:hypothetical protein